MGDGELNKMELWRASALWILGRWGCDLPSHFKSFPLCLSWSMIQSMAVNDVYKFGGLLCWMFLCKLRFSHVEKQKSNDCCTVL